MRIKSVPTFKESCLVLIRHLKQGEYYKTPVQWIINNLYKDHKPVGFENFPFCVQPINDRHPRPIWKKRSQVGATFAAICKMIEFIMNSKFDYKGRPVTKQLNALYTFSRQKVMNKFVSSEIVPLLHSSEVITNFLAMENSMDNLEQKQIGNNNLFFGHRSSEEQLTSFPLEFGIGDEWDLGDENVKMRFPSRFGQAEIVGSEEAKGLFLRFGHPELVKGDIVILYDHSDMHVWEVKCLNCDEWQVMEFSSKNVSNFYEQGQATSYSRKAKHHWICRRCLQIMHPEDVLWDRSNPDIVINGRWKPLKPWITEGNRGIRGYLFPIYYPGSSPEILFHQRDVEYVRSYKMFCMMSLGREYAPPDRRMSMDILSKHYDENSDWGHKEGHLYVAGIDQGCYLIIARFIPGSKNESLPYGAWTICWAQFIKNAEAFTHPKTDQMGNIIMKDRIPVMERGRLSQIMSEWNIDLCVIDKLPNESSSQGFAMENDGDVWRLYSGALKDRISYKENPENYEQMIVGESRVLSIENCFSMLRNGTIRWPIQDIAKGAIEEVWSHIESGELVDGEDGKLTYLKGSSARDDFLQAIKMVCIGIELLHKTKKPRSKLPIGFHPGEFIKGVKIKED